MGRQFGFSPDPLNVSSATSPGRIFFGPMYDTVEPMLRRRATRRRSEGPSAVRACPQAGDLHALRQPERQDDEEPAVPSTLSQEARPQTSSRRAAPRTGAGCGACPSEWRPWTSPFTSRRTRAGRSRRRTVTRSPSAGGWRGSCARRSGCEVEPSRLRPCVLAGAGPAGGRTPSRARRRSARDVDVLEYHSELVPVEK